MVLFTSHFLAFLFLLAVGIRRLICSFTLYLKDPSQFTSKPWYFSEPRWKNSDFYTLLVALPLGSFIQLYLFLAISGQPTYRFSFLQQAFVVFCFWALLIFVICKESFDLYVIPENLVFIIGGIAFLIEYLLNGKGIVGLGAVAYEHLGGLTLACAAACLYLSFRPSAFFADFLFSCGLVLKSIWVLQVGLSLYTDTFHLKGCDKITVQQSRGQVDVKCDLEEDKLRGISLMNLLFILHTMVVLMTSFLLFGLLHRIRNMSSGEASGPLLAQIRSDGIVMNQLPVFEIE